MPTEVVSHLLSDLASVVLYNRASQTTHAQLGRFTWLRALLLAEALPELVHGLIFAYAMRLILWDTGAKRQPLSAEPESSSGVHRDVGATIVLV